MKKLYNTIENNLKKGLQVVVQDLEDNTYCILSNLKDSEGDYRMSGWWESIEKAKQYIGRYCGYNKEEWDEYDLEIIEVYRPEFEPFKVGDKVKLLDSIKKTDDWEGFEDYFPNMTGVINQVDFENLGTTYKINGRYIGHEFVAPLNEVKEETIKIGDHTYSKSEVEKRLQGLKEI
jgi:hypothetical protein